ncbi:MAG: BON domain-containing protein [Steroidobacteraceae bacterium]
MTRKLPVLACVLLFGGLAGCNVLRGESTPSEYVDDVALTTKVKSDLLASKDVDGLDVNVDVKDGRVTLAGWATNAQERTRAARIARNVKGVKSVDNQIELKKN